MIKQLAELVGEHNIHPCYPLKDCSSFGIGGEAKFFATPTSVHDLFNLIDYAENNSIRFRVIGNGTNLLFSDNGFNGIVISTQKLDEIEILNENTFLVSAGTSLAKLIHHAYEEGLSGLEFAVGIPGTLGGAIVMNAGAGESDISAVIKSVTILESGGIRVLERESLKFSYRSSYFLSHPSAVILFAEIELNRNYTKDEIKKRMQDNLERRNRTQPKKRSAGCVFKKCGETPAGYLIDQSGLKGKQIGGARVSEIHANFIVNEGNASAKDVKKLIGLIETEVYKKYKKNLELEIEIIE